MSATPATRAIDNMTDHGRREGFAYHQRYDRDERPLLGVTVLPEARIDRPIDNRRHITGPSVGQRNLHHGRNLGARVESRNFL